MTHFSLYSQRADDVVLTLSERLAEIQSQMQAMTMTLRRMEQTYACYQQLLAATTTRQELLELAADFITVFEDDARSLSPDQIRLMLLQWKWSALRIVPLTHSLNQLTAQSNQIRLAQQTQDTSTLYTRCQLCQRYAPVSLVNGPEALLCVACQILLTTEPAPVVPFMALLFMSGRLEIGSDGQTRLNTYLVDGHQINLSQIMGAGQRVWLFQDQWVSGYWLFDERGNDLVCRNADHSAHSLLSLSGSLFAIATDQLPSSPPVAAKI